MQVEELKLSIVGALEELKAKDIQPLFVGDMTSVADWMIIASGTSNRHVRSLADNVSTQIKKLGVKPLGTEGEDAAEWVLVDFGTVIVHIMLPDTRRFYDLESLWGIRANVSAEKDRDF